MSQLTHADPTVRVRAIEVLGGVKHPAVIPLLKIGLADPNLTVFRAAHLAINGIEVRAQQDLGGQVVQELASELDNAIEGLYETALRHPNPEARELPASGLPPTYGLLLTLGLADPDARVRRDAVQWLYDQFRDSEISWRKVMKEWKKDTIFSKSERLLPFLRPLMETDAHPVIRSLARETFVMAASRDELIRLADAWNDPSPAARTAALAAIRQLRDPTWRPCLKPSQADPDPEVRYEAVRALCAIGAEEEVLSCMNDPVLDVQFRAAEFLQGTGRYDGLVLTFALRAIQGRQPDLAAKGQSFLRGLMASPAMSLFMASVEDPVQLLGPMALDYWGSRPSPDPRALPAIVKGLGHRNPDVRTKTLDLLMGAFPHSALTLFLGLASGADRFIAQEAVRGLGKLMDGRAYPLLLTLAARHPQPGFRESAVEAIGEIQGGDQGIPEGFQVVLQALEDEAPRVRKAAAHVLGQWRDERAAPPLARHVRDPAPRVRAEAAQALILTARHESFMATLLAALPEEPWSVQFEAACLADKYRPPGHDTFLFALASRGLQVFRRRHGEEEEQAVYVLYWSKHPQTLSLMAAVMHTGDWQTRHAVVGGLNALGPEGLALLRRSLGDPDEQVRSHAFIRLKQAPRPEAFQACVEAAGDASSGIRVYGIRGLAELKDDRAVPRLLAVARDADPLCRREALLALAGFGSAPPIVQALKEAVNDPASIVRIEAVHALGRLNIRDAIPLIQSALADPDFLVQAAALGALSELGVPPPAFHVKPTP